MVPSHLPPPPAPLPKATFVGSIRTQRLAFGASYPFGHLEFDEALLSIWGFGWRIDADRQATLAVRISTGLLAVKVSVVWLDGTLASPYFGTSSRFSVRVALKDRGWPVEETKWGRAWSPTWGYDNG